MLWQSCRGPGVVSPVATSSVSTLAGKPDVERLIPKGLVMSLARILDEMHAAEAEAGRPRGATTLVAVTKLQPVERIRRALEEGHRDFGENRVQEAMQKWPALRREFPDVTLHLLGPLQSNKVRAAVEHFDVIQSLARMSIARKVARLAAASGRCPRLLVQVNTGEERQKSGVVPSELGTFLDELKPLDLPIAGLMCIPPVNDEAALHFGLLAALAKRHGLSDLSMGMSADFESAIRLGATHVRIGTGVFGKRDYSLR